MPADWALSHCKGRKLHRGEVGQGQIWRGAGARDLRSRANSVAAAGTPAEADSGVDGEWQTWVADGRDVLIVG